MTPNTKDGTQYLTETRAAQTDHLDRIVGAHGLFVMGLAPQGDDKVMALVGMGRDCWPIFLSSSEAQDGEADPLDRWSKRIGDNTATQIGAEVAYPWDGPPYAPFIEWALRSGHFWQSPVGMLVHSAAGLMISIRFALHFCGEASAPARKPHPCQTCKERPCETACPVGALVPSASYNVPSCKAHIASGEGKTCLSAGCLVRRACPISQSFGRDPAQSGFHMKAFLGSS